MKTPSFIILILIFAISNSLNAQTFDFRSTNWGMDSNKVKKAELSRLIISRKNSLVYTGKLDDFDTKIDYNFTPSGELYHAAYIISLTDRNPQTYVTTFLMLQDFLTQKYNAPYDVVTSTINGKIIKQEEWATNLISDNLNLETKWKTTKTDISLSLFSISDELIIEVNYTSLEHNKKNSEEKKIQIMKDL